MLERILSRMIARGNIEIVDAAGRRHTLGDGRGPKIVIRFHDRLTPWKIPFNPDLVAGGAFVDGRLTLEEGSLRDLVETFCANAQDHRLEPTRTELFIKRLHAILVAYQHFNPLGAARRNVAHHYDLNERLFRLFLDSDMQYSCAYFVNPDDDIETAQEQKKRHIASKLLLKPGQRVLDIGSGWGGLGLYLARQFDVDVTGLTLSEEQLRVSNQRARDEGLDGRVRFRLQDYRKEEATYDRIVSVGMFEHVGVHHYPEFFRKVKSLLVKDGVALLHSIGHRGRPGPISPWVQKYIFPGAYLPALSEVFPALENIALWATDLEIQRLHYAETLRCWHERFTAERDRVRELYDERFCRMWELYLLGCEMGFRVGDLMVFQLQVARDRHAVPLTRDYAFETEERLGERERQRRRSSAA